MDTIVDIDRASRLRLFRKSEASNLIAEVFLDELQFILGEDVLSRVVVYNQGMNPRVESKDLISVREHYLYKLGDVIELTLARNSIYHQLPEFLFHPLTLGNPGMTKRQLVDAIKENRRKEKETIQFFSPFDTAFFKERVAIHQRYLNFFSDGKLKSLVALISSIIGDGWKLSQHQQYKLFLCLCKAERLKENLLELEQMLKIVMEMEVRLEYVPHVVDEMPYSSLGEMALGIDSGLSGEVYTELDDLQATLVYHHTIPDSNKVEEDIQTLKRILGFFVCSARAIQTQYTLERNVVCILGENRLGYDTHI